MTAHCPTAGFTCVDNMVAKVQAVADQISGLTTLYFAGLVEVDVASLIKHYTGVLSLMEGALDEYTQGHGRPSAAQDVQAALWVANGLRP